MGGSGDRELAQPLEQPLAHQVETLHERDKGVIAALYLELERSKRAVQQRADDEVRCARNVAARAEHEARRARAEVARLMRALQEAQGKAQSQTQRHAQPLHTHTPSLGRNSGEKQDELGVANAHSVTSTHRNGPDLSDIQCQDDRTKSKSELSVQQKVTQKTKARRTGSTSLKPARAKGNNKVTSKSALKLSVRRVDSSNTSSESSLSPLQRCRRISLGTQVQAQAVGARGDGTRVRLRIANTT